MPVTKLDTTAALVVIDLQKGIAGLPAVHLAGEIVSRAARLARAFREQDMTVVVVNVSGRPHGRTDAGVPNFSFPPDWTQVVPLRGRGVTQIFLASVATSLGVESIARSAYDLGYNVVLVVDAMTDRNADSHRHSVEKIFPRLGETDTTDNITC